MSAPQALQTGRLNAVASTMQWMIDNVPNPLSQGGATSPIAFTIQPRRPVQVADATQVIVSVVDIGMFQPQASDVDDLLTFPQGGTASYGREAQTLLEVIVWASKGKLKDADMRVVRVRDAITHAFLLAGRFPATHPSYVPPIALHNYADGSKAALEQYIRRERGSTWMVESDIQDPAHPEVTAWRMLKRILWWEFMEA